MKKGKILLGILVIALVFGMTVVGCDGGGDDPKSITITGITSNNFNFVSIGIASGFDNSGEPTIIAVGFDDDYNGGSTVTLDLFTTNNGKKWTDSGSFYLGLLFEDTGSQDGEIFFYSEGKKFSQLQILSGADFNNLPKYKISSKNSSIAFSQFTDE
jgi:hypothetical protein